MTSSSTVPGRWRDKLAVQFRLGWAHEYADTSRPVTAALAGAPSQYFTVVGAQPQRDAAFRSGDDLYWVKAKHRYIAISAITHWLPLVLGSNGV